MVIIGLFFSIIVYGGALNYVIPTVFGTSIVILLQQSLTGWSFLPWVTLGGGLIWSIPLSALKLAEAFVLVSDYPRTYFGKLLFSDAWLLISYVFRGFFAPETLPSVIVTNQSVLRPHEFEFGVSVIPAFLIVTALVLHVKQIRRPKYPFIVVMLALIIALPLVVTVGSEAWGKFLMRIPIINNNATLTRWYSIYILPLIILAAFSFDKISVRYQEVLGSFTEEFTLVFCIFFISLQLLGRDLGYYTIITNNDLYDPAPVMAEAKRILSGGLTTPITEIGPAPIGHRSMNAFLWGRSALPCYEPLFGYARELFPARQLRPGAVTDQIADNFINMADPRCYLTPGKKSCVPGSLFRTEEITDAMAFASHQPLRWQKPNWQKLAELVTLASLIVSAWVLLGYAVVVATCKYLAYTSTLRKG
jgi:hypothetical protein